MHEFPAKEIFFVSHTQDKRKRTIKEGQYIKNRKENLLGDIWQPRLLIIGSHVD